MSFSVEWSRRAEKQLARLDRPTATALVRFVAHRLDGEDDPRALGKRLVGSEIWRYRVGDYRILCQVFDDRLVVLVVELGHRREIYRR
ncbi:MAG: type II toxin-antitoxin system RelE family toxin [Phycicoccus sp.]